MKTKHARVEEANKRNEKWTSLSLEQQLKELNKRIGNSKKQKEKILNKINGKKELVDNAK